MPPRSSFPSLTPAFQRRLAKTPLRRKPQFATVAVPTTPLLVRSLHTCSPVLAATPKSLHAKFLQAGGLDLPPAAALSALLSRLSLPPDPKLHSDLLACLTHPSYSPSRPADAGPSPDLDSMIPTNEVFNSLGNSLLGMFASEHLAAKFPLMPTETLKMALTAYVGPTACVSVARELGVGVKGGGDQGVIGKGKGNVSAGIPVRWSRNSIKAPTTPVGERFKAYKQDLPRTTRVDEDGEEIVEDVEEGESEVVSMEKVTFDKVVASSVRAFVGLIYQEQGIHAARQFTHAHFLSRHLDLASMFSFRHPKNVLTKVVQRHLVEAGVPANDSASRIIPRVLAETGLNTVNPLINIGLFLPSGIKLAEGYGSSFAMAEHRAATNALLSLFLVRGDQPRQIGSIAPLSGQLPSSIHVDFPVDAIGVVRADKESFQGTGFGGLETNEESSKRAAYEGRVKAARKVIPVQA